MSEWSSGRDRRRENVRRLRKQNACCDKFDYVRASVPQCYNCLCFSVSVRMCVFDNSTLSLTPLTADYWCYMACGGAPG